MVIGYSGKLNKKDPSTIVIMTTQVTFTDDVKRVGSCVVLPMFHIANDPRT